jgi:hypothetical protein
MIFRVWSSYALGKDDRAKQLWSNVANSNNNQWKTIDKKKAKIPKCVTGTKKVEGEGGSKVKASGQLRGRHIFVGNLAKGTTGKMIEDQLEDAGVRKLSCKIFERKDSVSAHVVVFFEHKVTALDSSTWSEGVRVRNWSFDYSVFNKMPKDGGRVEGSDQHRSGTDGFKEDASVHMSGFGNTDGNELLVDSDF